jgi:hypothetical protein
MIEGLVNAAWARVLLVLMFTCFIIAPGTLFLTVFCPGLIRDLDFAKTTLLSIAIVLPLLAVNLLLVVATYATGINRPKDAAALERGSLMLLGAAAVLSILPLYGAILFRVVFGLGGVTTAIFVAAAIEIVEGATAGLIMWWCSPCPEEDDGCADEVDEAAHAATPGAGSAQIP